MPNGDDRFDEFGPGEDPTQQEFSSPAFTDTQAYLDEFGLPGPGFGPGQLGQPNTPEPRGMGKPILQLLGLLLAGGGVAGIGQNLFGRPPTSTATPQLSPQQLALLGASQGQFGQSQNILNLLMGGLQNPQIPPALSALTEQAFQPVLGNIGQQFLESIQRRGFAGSGRELLNTGLGGPALGQALSDVQGQMAQAKLNLYQNNINNLLQTLTGSQQGAFAQGRIGAGLPSGQQQQFPRPSILETLGQGLGVARGAGEIGSLAQSAKGPSLGSWLSGLNPFGTGNA